jgi:hypothetical protein
MCSVLHCVSFLVSVDEAAHRGELELMTRVDPRLGEALLELARTHRSAKYQALALHHLGANDEALAAAERTTSRWLVARVAPMPLARAAFDVMASRLGPDLRDGFVTRAPLARRLAR